MKRVLVLFACTLIAGVALCQRHTVSGFATDSVSGETLIAATVYDSVSKTGVVTNARGFYSLTLPNGVVRITCSYVGSEPQTIEFRITRDTTINFKMKEKSIGEIVVTGEGIGQKIRSSQMSTVSIPVSIAKKMPSLGGELDIIKAIQQMPGVQSGSEGSTGLYVRGGGADENLILLDGIPLYNINHAMGIFSVFNADIIKSFTLYKGNFPARFGGRLSSVLDVRQNDGNAHSYHGTVSVGLISAKANVEGPIWKDHTTFNVSFRRSYYDILAQPIVAAITAANGSPSTGGYYFYDLNAKVSHKFSDKDRLSASFFMDDDGIYLNTKEDDNSEKIGAKWRWGNLVAAANWTHVYSPKLISEMTAAYSQYKYKLTMTEEDSYDVYQDKYDMGFTSRISDAIFKYKFNWMPSHKHDIHFGTEYTYHYFRPSVATVYQLEAGEVKYDLDTAFGGDPTHNHEIAVYFEDDWTVVPALKLNLGLRGTAYVTKTKTYPTLEPRFGLRWLIVDDLSFKASYAYMSQFTHLLSSSNVTLPTDLWVPVTEKIKPMYCHNVSAGLFYNVKDWFEVSVEGFYKRMYNVVEYKDGATFVSLHGDWQDKVYMGDGWSYGVEFLIQRTVGKFTGWIGYTWSRSIRKFDREGMVINQGKEFPAKYDRIHDLSVCLQYTPVKLVDLAVNFVYGTGTCGTLPLQTTPDGIPFVDERNNFRMPDYHRLDVSANFHFARKKKRDGTPRNGEHQLNINIYNVYNHQNAYMVYISGSQLKQISIFMILPSVGYTFKF